MLAESTGSGFFFFFFFFHLILVLRGILLFQLPKGWVVPYLSVACEYLSRPQVPHPPLFERIRYKIPGRNQRPLSRPRNSNTGLQPPALAKRFALLLGHNSTISKIKPPRRKPVSLTCFHLLADTSVATYWYISYIHTDTDGAA